MQDKVISICPGDGIGPEIMDAVLHILTSAKVPLAYRRVEMGLAQYQKGVAAGISDESWETLRETGVLLKGPITTPQGGGAKSLNVTLRTTLGLFANVRPVSCLSPFVHSRFSEGDLVIVRENEEDVYTGIEYRSSDEVFDCLKIMSEPGCRRIARYAFDYAQANGRKRVTCMSKDNIMKLTDGLFHRVFNEIAADYPEIGHDHYIIDIGMARVAAHPEKFDVIVLPNLYGDILSDIAAEIFGSVGLCGSSNIGPKFAMFEAVHGSAPDIAGSGIANPSGLLHGAIQMLNYLGMNREATLIHNAWSVVIERGIHTGDIYSKEVSTERVGTKHFADRVVAALGERPTRLKEVRYNTTSNVKIDDTRSRTTVTEKQIVGVDVYVTSRKSPAELAEEILSAETTALKLHLLTNRGVKVWPGELPDTLMTDGYRCRFNATGSVDAAHIVELLSAMTQRKISWTKTQQLTKFDGIAGYSASHGE